MKLRDYQTKGINEIRTTFNSGFRRVCYVAPCGAGKTMLMAHMASTAAKRGRQTIFLVHRRELIDQASRTLTEYGIPHGVNGNTYGSVQVASVQTVARKLDKLQRPDLIIMDEAHHSTAKTWRKCLEYWPESYVVGLTATPARLGGQGLGDVFDSLVIGPTARELIQQGYLTSYKYFAPPQVADFENVKIKMGDYDSAEIEIRVNKPKVIGDAISHYIKLANGRQAIAYCASIAHSQNTAAAFQAAGITAKHVDGKTPKAEREQAVLDFREGRIKILCNVDLFGEGVDVPSMEAVILLRPTQSLTLYIQQSMRGMRPDKNNPFKEAIILDHVGNVHRHGLPDAPREWSLDGVTKRRTGEKSTVGIRQCLQCYACHSPAPVCPYCGYEYQMTARQLAEEAGELKEYDAKIAARKKLSKIITLNECKTIADLKEFAKANNYASGWVWHRAKIKNIRS